jgi:hypothetical protein
MEGACGMKIRLIRSFRVYRRGQVLDVPAGQARLWISHGIAVEETQGELLETATAEPRGETADATPRRKPRK